MISERDLQLDLAEFLRRCEYLTFTEIEIKGGRGGRADVVAVKPSYANKDVRIYEVKNTRSVFDGDSKYEKYLDVCHRMYIACPQGLIKKEELPPKIGLIVKGENGWHVIKAPQKNYPKDFNIDFILSLLYRGYEETIVLRKLRDRIIMEDNASIKAHANKIGFEIGRRLDRDRETQVEEWASKVTSLFKQYLDIEDTQRRMGNLPNIWEIENILQSVSGTLREVNNIKKIGEYLQNLNLPEGSEKYYRSLKLLREKVMEGIVERRGI
jgi:hypothetical protein